MKLQGLTNLDVFVLAKELHGRFADSVIGEIISKPDNIYFKISNTIIRFLALSGRPYLILSDTLPEGKNILPNIRKGRIDKISQINFDRLISFDVAVFDNLGGKKKYRIYFEFFGNGNIILTDTDNTVIKSYRRRIKKGERYKPSQLKGFNILTCDHKDDLTESQRNKVKALKLLQYSDIINNSNAAVLNFVLNLKNDASPNVLFNKDGEITGFTVYDPPFINNLKGEKKSGLLEALTDYAEFNISLKSKELTAYNKLLQKGLKKLTAIENQLEEAGKFPQYRKYGEIILANISILKKGTDKYLAPDPYSDRHEQIEIDVNPAVSPEKNAETYFNRARKLELSIRSLTKRLAEQKTEISKLRQMAKNPPTAEEVDKPKTGTRHLQKTKLPFRHYKLAGNWQIFIGKSATSNDELTFSFSRKDDLWFHAWQSAGSHLLLRRPQKNAMPGKDILIKAAAAAAYFSKAKHSSKVPVIYTEVRHVRKVRKSVGKVIVSREKQLIVKPHKPEQNC